MIGAPMHQLAKYASAMGSPDMARRSVWHLLAGRDHWALILIRHVRKGTPPEKPARRAVRLSPEWLRRTGTDLTPAELIHERIGQYLRAHAQESLTIGTAHAASIATDAVLSVLAELGTPLPGTPERARQEARLRAAGIRQFADSLTIVGRRDAQPLDARYERLARDLADTIEAF